MVYLLGISIFPSWNDSHSYLSTISWCMHQLMKLLDQLWLITWHLKDQKVRLYNQLAVIRPSFTNIGQYCIVLLIFVFFWPDVCKDTANGATDAEDDNCDWYLRNEDNREQCGNFDDDDFEAKAVCCACGGIILLRISDINNVF